MGLRSDREQPATGAIGREASADRSRSTATTWLRQGLRSGICPLCRVAHKADREYIWHFFDEGADQGESIEKFAARAGSAREHIEMLRRSRSRTMKSTLAHQHRCSRTCSGGSSRSCSR